MANKTNTIEYATYLNIINNIPNVVMHKNIVTRDTLLLQLVFSTNIRGLELVSLNWKNINFKQGYIRYYHLKLKQYLTIYPVEEIIDNLKVLKYEPWWGYNKKDDFVFKSKHVTPLTHSGFRTIINKYCRENNINLTPNELRNTIVT